MHPDHCNYPRGFCLNQRPRNRVCSKISRPPQIAPPVALENLFGDSLTSLTALGLRIPPSLLVRARGDRIAGILLRRVMSAFDPKRTSLPKSRESTGIG